MYLPFIMINSNQSLETDYYFEYSKYIKDKRNNEDIIIKLFIIYMIILIYVILWCLYDIMMSTIRVKLKRT